jgi:hypothetical protein
VSVACQGVTAAEKAGPTSPIGVIDWRDPSGQRLKQARRTKQMKNKTETALTTSSNHHYWKRRSAQLFGAFASLLLPVAALSQGSLTPPGAPAPTMKTLQQVEPRTDVLTLPPGTFAQYVISTPGSYYLTTNILGIPSASKVGILIQANNVTLDLNGFALIGNGSLYSGIWLTTPSLVGGATNVAVFNGTVTGWYNAGVYTDGSENCRFERLILSNNGLEGLRGASDSQLLNCLVQTNGTHGLYAGISVGSRCYVFNNNCNANSEGIVATGDYNRIDSNHLVNNGSDGLSYGIIVSANKKNLVVRNVAASTFLNSNFTLPSGNTWGPIVPLGGGVITGAASSTGWENFDDYIIF